MWGSVIVEQMRTPETINLYKKDQVIAEAQRVLLSSSVAQAWRGDQLLCTKWSQESLFWWKESLSHWRRHSKAMEEKITWFQGRNTSKIPLSLGEGRKYPYYQDKDLLLWEEQQSQESCSTGGQDPILIPRKFLLPLGKGQGPLYHPRPTMGPGWDWQH